MPWQRNRMSQSQRLAHLRGIVAGMPVHLPDETNWFTFLSSETGTPLYITSRYGEAVAFALGLAVAWRACNPDDFPPAA